MGAELGVDRWLTLFLEGQDDRSVPDDSSRSLVVLKKGEDEKEGGLTFSTGSMLVACRPKVRRRTMGAASVE